jgi:TolB-like protein/Flp pilus assembly protein TadD
VGEESTRLAGPSGAVFLSYASEDAAAAEKICTALRAAGIEVWFDRSELRGGDAWDRLIREQIHACRLFIPIISANTEARDEGYFRREWKLAVERTHDMSEKRTFILPVVADSTLERTASVPDKFREVQWTRAPAGETSAAFVARVAKLLGAHSPGGVAARDTTATAPVAGSAPRTRRVAWAVGTLVTLAALVVGAWLLSRHPHVESAPSARTASAVPGKSIAVLPFIDLSEKHDQQYFSDGLSEELIDVLTKLPGLRVPARTSSFSFKDKPATVEEIGHALGVTHVLEGSVRKSGERLRVTAQLVRADDGFHEWSQTYDRDLHDVLAVQSDIARSVAEQLNITLTSAASLHGERAVNPEAYSLYLQGRFKMESDSSTDLDAALGLFERASAVDPRFADAWAWFAYCQTRRIANGETGESSYLTARQAVARTLELDPDGAIGYVVGGILALQTFDWSNAGRLLDEALKRDPNNPTALQIRGHLSQAIGSIAEAETYMRRAIDRDPLNPLHQRYLARVVLYAGRAAESAAILQQVIEEHPDYPALRFELARALLVQGKPAEAAKAYEEETSATWRMLGAPVAYHITHRDAEARAALNQLLQNSAGSEFQVAEAYAVFNEPDRAFEWLENARQRHDAGLMYVRRDPLLATLFSDPRYQAFMQKLGLPP